jgi:hypothetical protein
MILQVVISLGCLLAAAAPLVGFARAGFGTGAAGAALLAVFWLVGIRRGWGWASSLLFYLLGALDGLSLLLGAPAFLAVLSLAAALTSWDLDAFLGRLERIQNPQLAAQVRRSHLARLTVALAAGLLLAGAALTIHVRISFTVAFMAGALAVMAFSRAIQRLAVPPGPGDTPDSYSSGG